MLDAALGVKRRDRLGAQKLAARRMHGLERHRRIDLPQHRANHVAALVDLGDQRVGFELSMSQIARADHTSGAVPATVASSSTWTMPSLLMPAATMPQASEPGLDDAGGSIPTAMRMSGGAAATRVCSIVPRDHSASGRSSMISPSISWRPSRVPA